ncbi:MAG: hypothetical protein GY733_11335 [bacterium]|nr:hypothetical protein [bacterium]
MKLRQIALVVRDLEPVVQELCAVLGVEVAYRDPDVRVFGLCNAVMPIGDTFLEVASPISQDAAAARWLERNGGDGGYMVIVETEDLDRERARIEDLGIPVAWEVTLDDMSAVHLHPRELGGAILSFDQPTPLGSWRWAGPDWQKMPASRNCHGMTGVELEAPNPAALAKRWSRAVGRPAAAVNQDRFVISLECGTLSIVPDADGRGERVSALQLRVDDPEPMLEIARSRDLEVADASVSIGGLRFDLCADRGR